MTAHQVPEDTQELHGSTCQGQRRPARSTGFPGILRAGPRRFPGLRGHYKESDEYVMTKTHSGEQQFIYPARGLGDEDFYFPQTSKLQQ